MRRENRELWMQENKHNNKRSKVTFPRLDDVMEIKDEIRKEVDHDMEECQTHKEEEHRT